LIALLAAAVVLLARTAPAQDATSADQPASQPQPAAEQQTAEAEPKAGHSVHGESFNEGPRQAASLLGGTGRVSFPATCKSDEVQQFINQGVGQVHGFWYFEAERSFRQAAALDPDCASAYWGMAMANANNATRAKGFIAEAAQRRDKASPREKMYIDALKAYLDKEDSKEKDADKTRRQALVKAYERIVHEHPDDLEAKAFLALQLWSNHGHSIPISSYFAVDALLQDIIAREPLHPCHHYVIHLWDYEKPERALKSAAMGGPAAPACAHMWHMPGHIYSRLKRYHDAVYQQEASARVDHARMMHDHILPDQIHNFAHNNEWLIRNLVHVGRAHDAVALSQNMLSMPRHPNNTFDRQGTAQFGRLRLFEALTQFEMWDDLIRLADTPFLEPTGKDDEQLKRLRHLGRACFLSGDTLRGCELLTGLERQRADLESQRDAKTQEAETKARGENKSDDDIKKSREAAARPLENRLRPVNEACRELEGYIHLAHRAFDDALASFKGLGTLPPGLVARVTLQAGQTDKAIQLARDAVKSNDRETIPLAHLVDVLWQAGKRDDAKTEFENLRALSESVDLKAPTFARLTPIAVELGYGEDWRQPLAPRDDLGERPPLDSLGPFLWQPTPAPEWQLADHEGCRHALAASRGKPVVLIFYLGYGCLHCAEQLQKFAPLASGFHDEGIEVIAVSTDSPDDLHRSLESYKDGPFPFPLVSNADLDVFRQYRCYDDFEKRPLHGTFVIDESGFVRWHDISHEPFADAEFVLNEARRLLSL
jgi:peroxiredoxin